MKKTMLSTLLILITAIFTFSQGLPDPVVFVQRQIKDQGSVFYEVGKDMAGVGARSRFRNASPGKLLVLETNGTVRTLIDGSNPIAASMNLIDVNAPDVSFDGTKIVFAGLPNGAGGNGPLADPGLWCIYKINVDGTGLTKLTNSFDLVNLNYSQFNGIVSGIFNGRYDDSDPAWLPDGRIVFSSTRWPVISQYSAASGTNLYVMNSDGSGVHRITAERSGADRPAVNPINGRIVYSRWWRNYRFPLNDETIDIPFDGHFGDYVTYGGLTANRDVQVFGTVYYGDFANHNSWQLAEINPDGTGLRKFSGQVTNTCNKLCSDDLDHAYGGSFAPDGVFYASFFPLHNMTEASGFGGIKKFVRGPNRPTSIIGVTTRDESQKVTSTSFGVQTPPYAGEADVLSDGNLIISWAADVNQDYGLYRIAPDGSGRTLIYDNVGTQELRAKKIRPRPVPPVISDSVPLTASALPPTANPPYDIDGTYTFNALNVYGNAAVDVPIASAIPVGSAAKIRFFLDHQRTSYGSFPDLDFPILINEVPIAPSGAVSAQSPANLQVFEQIRSNNSAVPIPFWGQPAPSNESNYFTLPGVAHVSGENFGRPGENQRCVGCHAGHSMIPVPAVDTDAQWTNLAPGAVSSVTNNLIDRKSTTSWSASIGQTARLTFPVSVKVRRVVLWGPTTTQASVKLFSDAGATTEVGSASGNAATTGNGVVFNDVVARAVTVTLTAGSSLSEVEVISSGNLGDTPPPAPKPTVTFSANPLTINTGNSSTLSWTTADATSVTIDNGVGSVGLSGTSVVSPTSTTTFTLTATGAGGTTTAATTITVNQSVPKPTVTFGVSPTSITVGGSANLSWSVTDADTVSIDQGIGTVAATGTVSVSPTATVTYTLTAVGVGGTTQASATLTVNPLPSPTATFSANPSTITVGASSTLSWTTTNATSVSIDQGIGQVALSGSVSVSPSTTTTYTLSVVGDGGSLTRTTTVTVNQVQQPLSITSLTLTRPTIRYGQFSKASFSLSGPAPAGGQVVTFESSDTSLAQVPSSVVVPQGISGGQIQIATNRNPSSRITQQVTITATVNGTSKSVVLTLTN